MKLSTLLALRKLAASAQFSGPSAELKVALAEHDEVMAELGDAIAVAEADEAAKADRPTVAATKRTTPKS